MRAHKLKIWPVAFRAVVDGHLNTQIRRNDRDFRVGDYLMLTEFQPGKDALTGHYHCVLITHIIKPDDQPRGLMEDFVALSTEAITLLEAKDLVGQGTGVLNRDVEWVKP